MKLRAIIVACLICVATCQSTRQLETFEAVYQAALDGEDLSVVVDREECGLDISLLGVAVLDLKYLRIAYPEDEGITISASTSFLAGPTVPDNPNVLVLMDIQLKYGGDVVVSVGDVDLKESWGVIGYVTATCSLNGGVKVFSKSADAPDVLLTPNDVVTAFFDEGRSLTAVIRLETCTAASESMPVAVETLALKMVYGSEENGLLKFDVPTFVSPASSEWERVEERLTEVAISDNVLSVTRMNVDPVTAEILAEQSYECPIPSSVTFFAAKAAESTGDDQPKALLSSFEEIRDSFVAGSKLRLRVDLSQCGVGDDLKIIAAGPLPWEYIVVPNRNRIVFTLETVKADVIDTSVFQIYEEGVVNVTLASYDRRTGDLLSSNRQTCDLDGAASGFSIVSSAQQQLTSHESIVESMKDTGRTFWAVTDFNGCELSQINEYGASGSLYDANFLLVDFSVPDQPLYYLFSPMSGLEPKSAFNPEATGLGIHDFSMYAFSPLDVLFQERFFDFLTFESIKDDFLFVCYLNNGANGAVSVYS